MKNYEHIEQEKIEQQSRVIRWLRWMGAILIPLTVRYMNKSREYAFRIRYTDEELLVVTRNRIALADAEKSYGKPLLRRMRRGFDSTMEDQVEVVGQELQSLMRLAGEKEDSSITSHHIYRVHLPFLKHLVESASRRCDAVSRSF